MFLEVEKRRNTDIQYTPHFGVPGGGEGGREDEDVGLKGAAWWVRL